MESEVKVAIVVGLFGLVTPLVHARLTAKPGTRPPRNGKRVLQVAVSGAVFFAAGFVASRAVLAPCGPLGPARVEITSPAVDAALPSRASIRGRACRLPRGEELWLLVQPDGIDRYYPQVARVRVTGDGSWSGTAFLGVGDSTEVGHGYTIYAARARGAGVRAIHSYMATRDYAGLPMLPGEVELATSIHVLRR